MNAALILMVVLTSPITARAGDLPDAWVGEWRITELVVSCGSVDPPTETVYDIELPPGPVTTDPDCSGTASEDRLEVRCVELVRTNGDCEWTDTRLVDWRLVEGGIEGTIHREIAFDSSCPFEDVCRDSIVRGTRLELPVSGRSWGALKARYR